MPSSVISYFNYNEKLKILTVTFNTGAVYNYMAVPITVYKMLKIAGSKGRYFNHYIKNNFIAKKVED